MKNSIYLVLVILIQVTLSEAQDVDMAGDLLVRGGEILLIDESTGVPKSVFMGNTQGSFSLQTVGTPGSTFYVARGGNVGVNTTKPFTDLHIKQANFPGGFPDEKVQDITGLTLEQSQDPHHIATIFVNSNAYLSFAFDTIQRSYIHNTTGDYVNMSDARLKKDIRPIENVLHKVRDLKPSFYHYNNAENPRLSIGFIAQEVEELFPELIHQSGEHKALAYDNFAVLAIKAIQEQDALIKEQKTEIDLLHKRLEVVEKLIGQDDETFR